MTCPLASTVYLVPTQNGIGNTQQYISKKKKKKNGKQISTIPLSMMRSTIFTTTQTTCNMAAFVLSFFVFRCLYVPYLWYEIQTTLNSESRSDAFTSCMPWHIPHVVFVFGSFFHCLNAFWFYKIVRKVQRKLTGSEQLHENNDLGEQEEKPPSSTTTMNGHSHAAKKDQ